MGNFCSNWTILWPEKKDTRYELSLGFCGWLHNFAILMGLMANLLVNEGIMYIEEENMNLSY